MPPFASPAPGRPRFAAVCRATLYVHLRVEPDGRFERSGTDLLTTLHLSVAQAALGTEIELDTLDGPFSLTVPPECRPVES